MTVLEREDILASINAGRLKIDPFVPENVNACAVDLRLGNTFRVYITDQIPSISLTGPKIDIPTSEVVRRNDEVFTFHPHKLVLAMTQEHVEIPNDLVGIVGGRSSMARLGTVVEMAARIDPGFRGNITLEIVNHGEIPVSMQPGTKVCALMLLRLSRETKTPYQGKYLDITKPEATRIASELRSTSPSPTKSTSKS